MEGVTFIEEGQAPYDVKILSTTTGHVPSDFGMLQYRRWRSITILEDSGVRVLDFGCFNKFLELESAVLPDSITYMFENIFAKCMNLKTVRMPALLEFIPSGCFDGCVALENIELPESIKKIGDNAFANCKSLTSLALPRSLEEIDAHGFKLSGLEEIVIGDQCKKIGTSAFYGCENLKRAKIESKEVRLGEAFVRCKALKSIQVEGGLIFVAGIIECTNLTEIVITMKKEDMNAAMKTVQSTYTVKDDYGMLINPFNNTGVAFLTLEMLQFRTLGGDTYSLRMVQIPSGGWIDPSAYPDLNKLLVEKSAQDGSYDLLDPEEFEILAARLGSTDADQELSIYEYENIPDGIRELCLGRIDLNTLIIRFLGEDEPRGKKRRRLGKLKAGKSKRRRENDVAMATVMIKHIL